MKKATLCFCFAICCVASIFVQQLPGQAGIGKFGPGRFREATSQDAADLSTTPAWFSNYTGALDSGLAAHTAVYDPATKVMIVFGGIDFGDQQMLTNAVLLFAPANSKSGAWTTLIPNGTSGAPPARESHTAVYDLANNRMIAFGGYGTAPLSDVWVLSNANGQGGTPTWAELSPSGTPPAARFAHVAAYDSKNNRMVIFGGGNGASGLYSDVWVLSNANGLGGTPAWTQLTTGGTPPASVIFDSATYDQSNNILTVFGGETGTTCTNGVWTLSNANGLGGAPQWTNIVADGAPGSPAQRSTLASVYDATNNRITIFGGLGCSGVNGFNDVWVLANANGLGGTPAWARLNPKARPGTRWYPTGVFDATTNQMMIFAGINSEAVYYVVWVLSHANGLRKFGRSKLTRESGKESYVGKSEQI